MAAQAHSYNPARQLNTPTGHPVMSSGEVDEGAPLTYMGEGACVAAAVEKMAGDPQMTAAVAAVVVAVLVEGEGEGASYLCQT